MLVDGDAGAGKTRLLSEIVRPAFLPKGYASVIAGALDYARAPYGPVRDLLHLLDKRFPKVLSENRLLSVALQPVLEFRADDENVEDPAYQRHVLDAVVQAVGLYAAQSPLLLALEDVHWIDSASANVLVHLSRAIPSMRALLLVSFRPTEAREDARAQHLLSQLSRSATLSLSLGPLGPTDSMMLIEDVGGPAIPMDVRRSICKLADGNPLLLVEFARVAAENPRVLEGSLPLSLKALVADRLARFDPVDVDVLRVAAVMGEFDPRILGEIAGMDERRVIATLRKARDASIVGEQRTDGAPFVFRHALIRHAITDDLLAFETAELHARIAERLEREPLSARIHLRLAHHFHHAGAIEKSREYNRLAAAEALGVYAYSDAVQLLERAIDARPLDEATRPLYEKLTEAYAADKRPADAAAISGRLFEFALRRNAQSEIATVGFAYARQRYQMLDDEGSVEVIRRACEAIDPITEPALAFNLFATHAWYLAQLRRTGEAATALQAASALREHGEDRSLVRYYEASAVRKVHAGEGLSYRADLESALAIAEKMEPSFFVTRLNTAMAISLASVLDDMDFARTLYKRLLAISETLPVSATADTLSVAAWSMMLTGDLQTAARVIAKVLPLAEEAPLLSFSIACAGIPVALRTGDRLLLRRCARPRLLEHAFASNTANVFGPVAAVVAEQLRAQNRLDEARELVTRAMKRLSDASNNIPLVIEAARCGAAEALERGLSMLADIKHQSRSADAAWHFARACESTGDERRTFASRAAEIFHGISWTIYEAQALEFAGRSEEALEIYRRCGCTADARRLEKVGSARTNTGHSKRVLEVSALVAESRSNRSIAENLSLSERTVENHIASIFAKLSLRSRAEIAAYIARGAAAAEESSLTPSHSHERVYDDSISASRGRTAGSTGRRRGRRA